MTTMNRISFAFFSILFALPNLGCHASSEGKEADGTLAPLKIANVTPGTPMANVVERLGEPPRREESDGFIRQRLVYHEIIVGFDEVGTVALIESKSKNVCLLSDICPGAAIDNMLSELARNRYIFEVVGERLIINGDGCWGEVRISAGVARTVSVRCSP